jgi:prolyl 4-hydroxylase
MDNLKEDIDDWLDLKLQMIHREVNLLKNVISLKSGDQNVEKKVIEIKKDKQDNESDNESDSEVDKKDKFTLALRNATIINNPKIDIFKIDNFLTKEECDEIIKEINKSDLKQSDTIVGTKIETNLYRTSRTCYFQDNKLIDDLQKRIAKSLGINEEFSEQIQGQKYDIGNEFKIHADFFDNNSNQRTYTFMIYLNDVEEGGETTFPFAYLNFKPKTGTALIWNNLNKDGSGNILTQHHAKSITKGTKYILTMWFREKIYRESTNKICINDYYPILHNIGFEKLKLNLDNINNIKEWMTQNLDQFEEDKSDSTLRILKIDKMSIGLQYALIDDIKKLLSKWIDYKSELTHLSTDDINEYKNGYLLNNHYDKENVISALIHLDHKTQKPWPLYIEDHNFKGHEINMEFGDVIFYESATCLHGRPIKFEGEYYRNLQIHFKPEKWLE